MTLTGGERVFREGPELIQKTAERVVTVARSIVNTVLPVEAAA